MPNTPLPDTDPHTPSPVPAPTRPSLRTIGPYQLLEKLGQGGMGTVYRAWHVALRRPVALKLLPAEHVDNPEAVARFRREMEAIGKLDHPHLVRATDAGEADGQPFLVMDLLDGIDLARLVQRCGPLRPADACELVRQAALGLDYLDAKRLVHRDIKPSNLLLSSAGLVKVLDLGLAHLADPECRERLTASGLVVGTGDYMAPEQATASHRIDIRADLYSLGCTLYKLLTGQPPFPSPAYPSYFEKIKAHAETPPPLLDGLRPGLPADLRAVAARLLRKSPAERFALPADLVRALEPLCAGCDLPRLLVAAGSTADAPRPPGVAAANLDRTPSQQSTPLQGSPTPTPPPAEKALPGEATTSAMTGRRRPLAWRLAGTAVLLLGLAYGLALLKTGNEPRPPLPTPPGPKEAVEVRVDDLAPGEWHPLLQRQPEALRWPTNPQNADWTFDAEQKILRVNCAGVALFRLGETARPRYELKVSLQQNQWTGGVGVFFGCATVKDPAGTISHRYQLLELRKALRARKEEFNFTRAVHVPNGQADEATAWIPPPRPGPQVLRLTVGPEGLEGVWWGEQELRDLASPEANQRANNDRAKYKGIFGVYNHRAASFVPAAAVRLSPRNP